ncbi:MAG: ATPase [Bacteroidales bacterium]|jgi:AAA+ ATPase superfamily predicted ATPase|nr:ATPase [Bacteroidales bacterium]
MIKVENPFVTVGYVSEKYFCDRENETKRLIKEVVNGNNLTLVSTRRMGKSGLIEHCFRQKELKNDYYLFYIDIFATKNLNDFVFQFGKNIIRQLKPFGKKAVDLFVNTLKSLKSDLTFDAMGNPILSVGLGNSVNLNQSLDEIFEYINKTDKPCIVAIDEFQQILRYPESNTEALLRTYIQQSPLNRFIFSGSQRHLIGEMFISPTRPFFASSSMFHLEPISLDKYIEFAQQHFSNVSKSIDKEVISNIYQKYEGITWYIQKILNKLFDMTAINETCDITYVEPAVKYIIDSFQYAYSEMVFLLPDKQLKLLIAIAKEGKATAVTSSNFVKRHHLVSASSVQAALAGLLEKEFITCEENRYSVYNKFFGQWLISNF